MENAPIRDDGSHITDEEVNLAVADGSGFEKGKLRIYRHFTEKRGNNAEFLKKNTATVDEPGITKTAGKAGSGTALRG